MHEMQQTKNSESELGSDAGADQAAQTDVVKSRKIEGENPGFSTRLVQYAPSILALIGLGGLAVFGLRSEYFQDLSEFQRNVIAWALAGVALMYSGFKIGQVNCHVHKNVWVIADLIWLAMAIPGTVGIIAPVQQYMLSKQIDVAESTVLTYYDALVMQTVAVADKACQSSVDTTLCLDWKKFGNAVLAPGYLPQNISTRVETSLKNLPASAAAHGLADGMAIALKNFNVATEDLAGKRKEASAVSIDIAYWTLSALAMALFVRTGRSGADYGRNKKEPKGGQNAVGS